MMAAEQKRKIQWAISLLLMILYFYGLPAEAKYGGGTGEPNDPYLIYTAEQMNEIGLHEEDWNKHFKLMADIDLSSYAGTDFNIIGYYGTYKIQFTGVFDGSGHKISNFSYTSTDTSSAGLFGFVSGVIRDLALIDPNIDAGTGIGVGSLVGLLSDDGTIYNCYAEGGSVSGNENVGGLVGENNYCTITNCYSTASVSGGDTVGGLVGWNEGTITNCYSVGRVTGTTDVGGLVGINSGQVTDSFWDIQTSEQSTSGGGTGKTTAEMQIENTFTDAGWDFVGESVNGTEDIWSICEGTNYPRFVWQITAVDFVCPDGITTADYLFFLEHWLDDNCDSGNDYCDGTDLDFSGKVDVNDLAIFFENWPAGGELEN